MKIKSLIERAKRGDKEAFAQLMDEYRGALYHTALLIVKNEEDALDAIGDTVLACWENLPRLKQDRYFKTWMTRILFNKCYDILRVHAHFSEAEDLSEIEAETGPDLDRAMDVRQALAQLQENDRLILSLFYYDDFSIRQISSLLSLSENAVKTRLNRSRNRFRSLYTQEKGAIS